MYLLKHPDQVHTDSFTVFTSALWFYMTPQSPKPSIHDVATGFMIPTSADEAAGLSAGFGVTTNIINGMQECGRYSEDTRSQSRISYYKSFLNYFGLPEESEESMRCGGQKNTFPEGGYGDEYSYFDKDWTGGNKCLPVKWQTPYSVNTRDDYKRCICDIFGQGETDCAQEPVPDCGDNCDDSSDSECGSDCEDSNPCDEDSNLPQCQADHNITDPAEEFEQIWNNKHYSEDKKSRTNFQIDRSLDYVEKKLTEMHAVLARGGLLRN